MLKSILKVLVMISILFQVVSCSLGGSSSSSGKSSSSPAETGSKFTVEGSYPTGHELVFTVVNNENEAVVDQFKIPYKHGQSDYYVSLPTYDSSLKLRTVVVLNNSAGYSLASDYSDLGKNWSITVSNDIPEINSDPQNDIIALVNREIEPIGVNFYDYEAGYVYDSINMNYQLLDITYRFIEIPQNSRLSDSDIAFNSIFSVPGYAYEQFYFTPDVSGTYLLEIKCFDGVDTTTEVITVKTPNSGEGVVDVSIS